MTTAHSKRCRSVNISSVGTRASLRAFNVWFGGILRDSAGSTAAARGGWKFLHMRLLHKASNGAFCAAGRAGGWGVVFRSVGQAAAGAFPARQSLSRLWVAAMSFHSAWQARRPRRWKRSIRRRVLVLAKTGSTICCRRR